MYSSAPIRFDLLLCLAGKILPTQPPGRGRGAGIAGGGKAGLLRKDWKGLAQQNAPVRGKRLLGVPCVHAADLGFYSSFHGDSGFLFQYSCVVVACNVRHSQERGNTSPGEQCC